MSAFRSVPRVTWCSVERVWIQGCLIAAWPLSRSFGFFCISDLQKSFALAVTRSQSAPSNNGSLFWMIFILVFRSAWWNGRLPHSSMYVTTPIAHMSTLESYACHVDVMRNLDNEDETWYET